MLKLNVVNQKTRKKVLQKVVTPKLLGLTKTRKQKLTPNRPEKKIVPLVPQKLETKAIKQHRSLKLKVPKKRVLPNRNQAQARRQTRQTKKQQNS